LKFVDMLRDFNASREEACLESIESKAKAISEVSGGDGDRRC